MASGAVLYTTVARYRRKGEVLRAASGRGESTSFPHRNDRAAARPTVLSRARGSSVARTSRSPCGYCRRTEGWMSLPVLASAEGLATNLVVRP